LELVSCNNSLQRKKSFVNEIDGSRFLLQPSLNQMENITSEKFFFLN